MKSGGNEYKYRGIRCLNCAYELDKSEKYCAACGQLNSTKKLSFDDFFNEFFAGIFAYDSRFRRTLRALLFQPGKISKDYIQGKRMRYANPFRFYLSASIIFFLIWSFTNSLDNINIGNISQSDFQQHLNEIPQDSLGQLSPTSPTLPAIDSLIAQQQKHNQASYKDIYVAPKELDTMSMLTSGAKRFEIFSKFYREHLILNAEIAMDSLQYPQETYNYWLYKKAVDWTILKENPEFFLDYFMGKLPFIIFFYLPVFAFFIWLLYIRRAFNYMEHLIFTFHVQTTFFVIFALALLLDKLLQTSWFITFGVFAFCFYLYKALHKFYNQGHVKTLVKFMILNVLFFILAGVATIFSLLASFAIY